jgi:hypothetical protein
MEGAEGMSMSDTKEHEREVELRIREAAQRAVAEAEDRRAKAKPVSLPKEIGGPAGLEPTRYGDWERKGIVSDF